MCGIVGTVVQDGGIAAAALAAMRDVLRHGGPDAEGLWLAADRRAGLAHRRLEIIDLSAAADQPRFTVPPGVWIGGGDCGPYLRSVLGGIVPEIVAPREVARLAVHGRRHYQSELP